MKTIHNLDLTEYNSYKVHSIAALAFFPECLEDFSTILSTFDITKSHIIGKGCNTIFAKDYYPENQPLIFIRENFSNIELKDGKLYVAAGTDLKDLSLFAMEHSMAGLEYFYDILGCVGGAITMNAGSCGVSFSDYIEEITYMDCMSQNILTISKGDMKTGYRESIFKSDKKYFILSCVLALPEGDKDSIMQEMEAIKTKRYAKQPREYPNAGSVFIRPAATTYVGPMIEKLGLKGYRIGGAEISSKHAGFIVNIGGAKGSDIVSLITYVAMRVKDEFGVELKTEQRILL